MIGEVCNSSPDSLKIIPSVVWVVQEWFRRYYEARIRSEIGILQYETDI
jgi:hypothetical protein